MLVGTPLPVNLSVFVALGPALWIRSAVVFQDFSTRSRVPWLQARLLYETDCPIHYFEELLQVIPSR